MWNAETGEALQTLQGHSNGVTALAFSPGDQRLVSGGRGADNTVKVWAPTNSNPIRTFAGHSNAVEAVAFSPDGDCVASGSSGAGALRVSRISDGTSQSVGSETNAVFFVAFSPNGTTLASAGRDATKLWDVATLNLSQTLTQEMQRVLCLAYSPNGSLILHGREDGTVVLSDNELGACGRQPLTFTSIAADVDGTSRMDAAVQPRTRYVIEASSNLADWDFLTLAVSETNDLSVTDSCTNGGTARFYRALTPP